MEPIRITELAPYIDEHGNQIIVDGVHPKIPFIVVFKGSGNILRVDGTSMLRRLSVYFESNGARARIGSYSRKTNASWSIHLGHDSTVEIGSNVSTANTCGVFSAEGAKVQISDDCMIAADCRIRGDDAHPIYDVISGKRLNHSQDVILERHVWLAYGALILPGVRIGEGSVIGTQAVVTKSVPNNSIAAGAPARTIRKNIAWERTDIKSTQPKLNPDSSVVVRSNFWNLTKDNATQGKETAAGTPLFKRGRQKAARVLRRFTS